MSDGLSTHETNRLMIALRASLPTPAMKTLMAPHDSRPRKPWARPFAGFRLRTFVRDSAAEKLSSRVGGNDASPGSKRVPRPGPSLTVEAAFGGSKNPEPTRECDTRAVSGLWPGQGQQTLKEDSESSNEADQ